MVASYIEAATASNTRKSYQSDIRQFEEWGGLLPASIDAVAKYLADSAQTKQPSTLRRYLASLSKWHQVQGFIDPTKSQKIKTLMRGISKSHQRPSKQAKPIAIDDIGKIDSYLSLIAANQNDHMIDVKQRTKQRSVALRDKAMVLVGFWRAMRGAELLSIKAEDIRFHEQGVEIYVRHSKTDKQGVGTRHKLPYLRNYCPVTALRQWLDDSGIEQGDIFPSFDRWGNMGHRAMHENSLIPWLRPLLIKSGVSDSQSYSAHSMRRGFATYAVAHGTNLQELMSYVGWKDASSAMRYIESSDNLTHSLPRRLTQQ